MSDKDLGVTSTGARDLKPIHAAAVARPLDACQRLGISQSSLRRLVKAGKLRQVHLGPRARGYRISDLDDFLAGAVA